MATVDKTSGSGALGWDGKDKFFQMYQEVTLTAAETVNANVIRCIKIPDKCIVRETKIQIITPAVVGTSLAAGVGVANSGVTGNNATGFDAAIDLTAAAKTVYQTAIGTDAFGAGGFVAYVGANAAGASIDLTLALTGAVTTPPKVRVWANCELLNELT